MAERGSKKAGPLSILLVDDNKDICDVLSEALTRRGYVVKSKNSTSEAVKELHTRSYDVLLTDLIMPNNGNKLLEEACEMAPTMVKIIMTGCGDTATFREAMDAGASEHLSKPVQIDEVEVLIKKLIKENRNRQNLENLL